MEPSECGYKTSTEPGKVRTQPAHATSTQKEKPAAKPKKRSSKLTSDNNTPGSKKSYLTVMGNFMGVRNQVPVENKVSDGSAQMVGWGNTVQKGGDIEELNQGWIF